MIVKKRTRPEFPVNRRPLEDRMKIAIIVDPMCDTEAMLDPVVDGIDHLMSEQVDPVILIRGNRDRTAAAWASHEWCLVQVYWPNENERESDSQANLLAAAEFVVIVRPTNHKPDKLTVSASEFVKSEKIGHRFVTLVVPA